MELLFTKVSKSAEEAWSTIPLDVWSDVASYLEPIDILSLGRASKEMHGVMMYGDIWLNKLTVLMLQYPVLSQLEQATGEIPYIWYKRCQSAVGGGQRHAARHFRGESPYLELHGSIDGTTFTPFHNRLQFPVENGVIVELIQLLHKKIPSPRDACVDALEYFNIPDGVELDGTFRNIVARIKKMRARATVDNLRQLPEMLGERYLPRACCAGESRPTLATPAATSTTPASTSATPPVATSTHCHPALAVANKLRLRLRRASTELAQANATIEKLEAQVAQQAKYIKKLEAENRVLRAENARLTGCKRRLEAENEGLVEEMLMLKETSVQELAATREQLRSEALKRRAAERVSSTMEREQAGAAARAAAVCGAPLREGGGGTRA